MIENQFRFKIGQRITVDEVFNDHYGESGVIIAKNMHRQYGVILDDQDGEEPQWFNEDDLEEE